MLVDAFPMGIDFDRFSKDYSECEDFTKAEKEILEIKQIPESFFLSIALIIQRVFLNE